ncbi:MAG TPA: helix-turn-helix domain-containing protein [Candidatus Angelobacter sp.]|nr:helix-turn-helix domain-containing protein [Candidatus Angelobacter sp.]
MLEGVGVSAVEEALYLALVDHPVSSDGELAELVGISVEDIEATAVSLGARGLVTRSATRPPRYVAAPAPVAIEVLILQRQEELERTRLAAAQIGDRQRQARPRNADGPPLEEVVEVVIGREAISQRHQQLQRTARLEIRAFDKGPYAADPVSAAPAEERMLGRGVRVRAVYDMEGLSQGQLSHALRAVAAGEEARTARVPAKLVIVDGEAALLPLQDELEGALFVHPSPLLELLIDLFERVWADASAFVTTRETEGELEAIDRRILALLASGATDTAICHDVRIDHRSVQRRVARIMRILGARSRFQGGALAAARGWLGSANAEESPGSLPELPMVGAADAAWRIGRRGEPGRCLRAA